jgi:hypothetical protein
MIRSTHLADDADAVSILVTGYDQVAVGFGVLCRLGGARAGRPGRFTYGSIGCSVTGLRRSSPRQRRTFAWTDVVGAERTRSGVRFHFADESRTVAIGALRTAERTRLVEAARTYCPVGTLDETFEETNERAAAEQTSRLHRLPLSKLARN